MVVTQSAVRVKRRWREPIRDAKFAFERHSIAIAQEDRQPPYRLCRFGDCS